jgi:uncharacterized protein YcnI/copper(I)-binding protein
MFRSIFAATAVASLGLFLAAPSAEAHATFETSEASPNAGYKGVVRIGHGCEGSPTHTVTVSIPEGVIAVKPMPKAGWKLETREGDYAKSYDYFGKPLARGVREIIWSGGRLLDSEYDEFVFSGRMSGDFKGGDTVYFPVVQLCEKGDQRWVQIPAPGQDPHALKGPAPGVKIRHVQVAQAGGGHGHQHGAPVGQGQTISILQPWARATPPGAKVAGGYLKIENRGATTDRLVSASSDIAGVVEIHEMAMDGGVMKMRALEKGLDLKAASTTELKPGGYHIMFIDLKRPLKEGDTVRGELVFEKAGRVPIEYKVMAIGARDAGHAGHRH